MTIDSGATSRLSTIRVLISISLSLLLGVSACSPQPYSVTREPTALRLAAAGSCQTIALNAASEYQEAHPWIEVSTELLNNALTADALRRGRAHIGLLSWPPATNGEDERLWTEPFARDGVAVIVSANSSLSLPQLGLVDLGDIFLGRLQEADGVILSVVSREDGSGTRAAFESIVLDGQVTTLNAVVMPSAEAMIDYVSSEPAAIGYVSTALLDDRVRTVPVEGELPTAPAISSGAYPLSRDLYLASAGEPTGEARQFAQWILRRAATAD